MGSTEAEADRERAPGRLESWRQRVALRTRVALLAALCVGTAVALTSLGAFVTVYNSLYDQLDDSLFERAAQAAEGPRVSNARLDSAPAALFAAADVQIAEVYESGAVVFGGAKQPPVGPKELAVAKGELSYSLRTDVASDSRVITLPIQPGSSLVVAQPLDDIKATLGRMAVVVAVAGGLGVGVAAAAGTAVARTALRPVSELTAATERISRTGDLRPIEVSGDDELARLTTSFNVMLGVLAESQERQRRLVADAGHELRTPLTSLRTNIELLLASSRPDAPELAEQDRAEIYDDVRAQINELSTLVGDLVELAREDAPQVVHEPVDLVEVIERAVDRARRRAPDIDFEVSLTPWWLLGDANALERAVLNLLDNAAKWSPSDGAVQVNLAQDSHGSVAFEVADSGPGIAEADMPHVFERFYRSSEARTLPGSGLGLAIVKQAAERHGGSVSVGRAPQGGALFMLRLPGRAG
ncbi:sensor histidine kinase [Actinoalloteichus hymeniacidonis]|nr:HAMP domain-containing sensor histidine kinase [Actinoalloteichus hymeniacidonis]